MTTRYALWVDDHWAPDADEAYRQPLEEVRRAVERALERNHCDVVWSTYALASEAGTELAANAARYSLVIVDFDYAGQAQGWDHLLRVMGAHGVWFVVLSAFPAHAERYVNNAPHRRSCIGIFNKDKAGRRALVDRVTGFFRAPPLRIAHVSDLHCSATAVGARDQERMFAALVDTLRAAHAERAITLLVLSGDFASGRPAEDLVVARDVVRAIIDATIGRKALRRCLVVPGNHDIEWEDFGGQRLAPRPWLGFLEFYQDIFQGTDIPSEMAAWRPEHARFDHRASVSDLIWHRPLPEIGVSAVGISTPIAQGRPSELPPGETYRDAQGQGEFTDAHDAFIRQAWGHPRAPGELRLAVMHHNLMATLATSRYDEKRVLRNPGQAMLTLADSRCTLVFSGHTHAPNLFRIAGGMVGRASLEMRDELVVAAAGTTGGLHPGGDRGRSFSLLDLSHAHVDSGTRELTMWPFLYDSQVGRWDRVGEKGATPPHALVR
ncbi:MAG: metallophosphoesterase [Gemmatirosa sp.]|nr:metallophosphoesterase [Gemmatirosa sp.]